MIWCSFGQRWGLVVCGYLVILDVLGKLDSVGWVNGHPRLLIIAFYEKNGDYPQSSSRQSWSWCPVPTVKSLPVRPVTWTGSVNLPLWSVFLFSAFSIKLVTLLLRLKYLLRLSTPHHRALPGTSPLLTIFITSFHAILCTFASSGYVGIDWYVGDELGVVGLRCSYVHA